MKTRFEIFVTEQECIYRDLDDKDQDAIYVFCWNDSDRVAGCLRVFWKDHDEAAGVAQIGKVVTLEHSKGIGSQMFHEGIRGHINVFAGGMLIHAMELLFSQHTIWNCWMSMIETIAYSLPEIAMVLRLKICLIY